MTEFWHRTADLVGLPGMPNVARPIRLHGAGRGWTSRETKWGARTRLEWLESSLPAETQTALRAARNPDAPATPLAASGDSAEPDGGGICSPPSAPPLFSVSGPAAVADARMEVVTAFTKFHAASGLALVPAMKLFATEYPAHAGISDETRERIPSVSWSTLRRWRNARRDGGHAALMPGRGGRPSVVASDPKLAAFVEAMLRENPHHVTARNVLRAIRARLPDASTPGIASIRRFMRDWRERNGFGISACSDPDGHRSRTMPAFGDGSWDVEHLNQLWELDSTRLDVICADGTRWDVCVAVDVWSRRVKAFVTQRSEATAIAALVRRCLLDWGVPQVIRTDEGKDYTSRRLRRIVHELDLVHDILPPYRPDLKPHVERAIGTMTRDLLSQLPGFCGHDVADAQRIRGKASFAARRGKDKVLLYGVDLTAEQLQGHIDDWCDTLYGREPHAGLGGMSPFEKAASWAGPQPKRVTDRGMDVLLAPAAGDGRRKVGKDGIRVDGGIYIAAELGSHMDEWVHVRQDPGDWGRIWVFTDDPVAPEFIATAEDPARTGIDRREVAVAARRNWAARNAAERKRARDLAHEHEPAAAIEAVLERARQDAGKVVALPTRADAHETPATVAAKAAETHDATAPARAKRRMSEEQLNRKLWS